MSLIRALLETLKFLTPREVLESVMTICKSWHQAADSEELWATFLRFRLDCDWSSIAPSAKTAKEAYRIHFPACLFLDLSSTGQSLWGSGRNHSLLHRYLLGKRNVSRAWIRIPPASFAIAQLPNGCIFLCTPSSDDYFVNPTTQSVSTLEKMIVGRESPGLTYAVSSIYAFGGERLGSPLDSAEKYDIATNTWRLILSTMNVPRYGFTPVLYKELIYLVGGYHYVNSSETFDIGKETFSTLQLPDTFSNSQPSYTWLYHDSLIFIQNQTIVELALPDLVPEKQENTVSVSLDSRRPPVSFNSKLYFVSTRNYQTNDIYCIDPVSLQSFKVDSV